MATGENPRKPRDVIAIRSRDPTLPLASVAGVTCGARSRADRQGPTTRQSETQSAPEGDDGGQCERRGKFLASLSSRVAMRRKSLKAVEDLFDPPAVAITPPLEADLLRLPGSAGNDHADALLAQPVGIVALAGGEAVRRCATRPGAFSSTAGAVFTSLALPGVRGTTPGRPISIGKDVESWWLSPPAGGRSPVRAAALFRLGRRVEL